MYVDFAYCFYPTTESKETSLKVIKWEGGLRHSVKKKVTAIDFSVQNSGSQLPQDLAGNKQYLVLYGSQLLKH